jgi:hypothetical protein
MFDKRAAEKAAKNEYKAQLYFREQRILDLRERRLYKENREIERHQKSIARVMRNLRKGALKPPKSATKEYGQ